MNYDRERNVNCIGDIDEDMMRYVLAQLDNFSIQEGSELPVWLTIKSVGGDPNVAFGIFDSIRLLDFPVYTVVLGEVCSSAVPILLAGKKRYMTKHSRILLHNMTVEMGGSADLRNLDILINGMRKIQYLYIQLIAQNTKQTKAQVLRAMQKTTILNPTEAKQLGYIHKIL